MGSIFPKVKKTNPYLQNIYHIKINLIYTMIVFILNKLKLMMVISCNFLCQCVTK